jgi:transcriptional regulator with XRE-family HTH domain/tetratricopeptide (TPR) repeat protein
MERKRLVAARRAKGWNQTEAAEQVGVTWRTWSSWERGHTDPYPCHVQGLCTLFSRSAEDLDLVVASDENEESEYMDPSRRQILRDGATLLSLAVTGPIAVEEFLAQCTSGLRACWHMMKGNGVVQSEQLLNSYLPTLTKLMFLPSGYQEMVAALATEAKFLQALLAIHTKISPVAREICCHQAVQYSQVSGDPCLMATARMYLAHTHSYYMKRPEKAIPSYLEALHTLGEKDSLLRSAIYMGLACAYSRDERNAQKALEAIGLAKEHFPKHPELDPHFLYAEASQAGLHKAEGRMYFDLGKPKEAYESLLKSVKIGATTARGQAETDIHFAKAALRIGDMEHYVTSLREGALQGIAIGSKKAYHDALTVFQETPKTWQREPLIQALREEVFVTPL